MWEENCWKYLDSVILTNLIIGLVFLDVRLGMLGSKQAKRAYLIKKKIKKKKKNGYLIIEQFLTYTIREYKIK